MVVLNALRVGGEASLDQFPARTGTNRIGEARA